MPGAARKIVVEFIGEDRSLSSAAKRAEGTTGRLGGRLSKVGVVAGAALAGGLALAAKGMVDMGKAAAEDQASATKLATALKNTTGATSAQVASVESWISAQGRAFGVADDQLRPALQKLVTATGDVGEAQRLAGLAMNVSAGTGKSLESVSTALAKAQNGNTAGLSKLGVATKDAAGHALSFDQIQQNLAKTFKGQAAAGANTLQGRIGRLRLMFDETKESIGYKLLPIAEKFTGWVLNKAVPGISEFVKQLRGKLGPAFTKLRPIFASIVSIVKSAVSIVTSLWKRFGDTITTYAKTTFRNLITVIGGAFKIIQGVFKVFSSLLKGDWKGVWDGIKQIASGAWSIIKGVVSQGWNVIKSLFSVGAAAIKGIFGGLWSGVKSLVSSGLNSIVSTIRGLPGKIRALGGSLASAGKGLMTSFLNGIASAAGALGNFASGVWNAIKAFINRGIDRINYYIPNKLGKGALSISIPANPIPHLYKGGIVPGSRYGTPVIAGDRGNAEAIVPLSGPHARGLGGTTVNVYVSGIVGDETAVIRKIEQGLVQRVRTTGRPLAFVTS